MSKDKFTYAELNLINAALMAFGVEEGELYDKVNKLRNESYITKKKKCGKCSHSGCHCKPKPSVKNNG